MSTSDPNQPLPEYQQQAAANAHLTPNPQADQAKAGTPDYGSFGKPGEVQQPTPRDGSNDNPDEFSEFRKDEDRIPRDGTTDSPNSNPYNQTGHVVQNRDPEAVRKAQGDATGEQQEEDNTRQAWAQDDERYAGGHAKASWTEQNDQEHNNS